MIHAQQKGYSPAEILRGLCDAVARNFKSSIVKGRPVEAPVALIGAVSQNAGVTGALREAFSLAEDALLVPEHVRLVRGHRHRHPGGRRAAQAVHSGDPPPAPARCRRHRAGYPSALHRKRGAVARPRGRLCSAFRRRPHPGVPRPGHRFGLDQRGGDRRIRLGHPRCVPAHRRAAHRGRAARAWPKWRSAWGSAPADLRRGHHRIGPRADR